MIITNNLNLPSPFVKMAQIEYEQESNEYRVTQLLRGVRETILEKRHKNEITMDVADMIWLLFGTAVHNVLEHQAKADDELREQRIKIDIGEYILSGQFDLFNESTKTITDYKTCSVWKVMFSDYSDWRKQLNIYAYMLKKKGYEVKKGNVVALMKDHNASDAKYKPDYPLHPVKIIEFKFMEKDFCNIDKWLINKFAEIKKAEAFPDDELPICTPEERFNSGTKYAVIEKNRKRALRVFDTRVEADKLASECGAKVEERAGVDKKCLRYCAVREYCSYYKEVVKG